jgi:hypothetical protein
MKYGHGQNCPNPVFSSVMTYHRACNKCNTTAVACGAGTAYSQGKPEFTNGFSGGTWLAIFSFMCSV